MGSGRDGGEAAAADDVPAAPVPSSSRRTSQVFNDFVTPARHVSRRAVVHYVVLGISAPPLNDDDADGVPDYVERVGDAADTAIAYYERRGFARDPARTPAGRTRAPTSTSRASRPGYFGVAFPAADAEGGAFLAVSNALDPSPAQSLGSLYGTVAHELFHLVQFSYFKPAVDPPARRLGARGARPRRWKGRVYPDLEDIVSSLQLRHWFAAPQRSVTEESYGAQLLWQFLDERQPALLPAYLTRGRARGRMPGAACSPPRTSGSRGGRSLRSSARFAAWAAERYGDRLEHLPQLARERARGRVGLAARHPLRPARRARCGRSPSASGERPARVDADLRRGQHDSPGDPAAMHRARAARATARGVTFAVPPALRSERALRAGDARDRERRRRRDLLPRVGNG